MRIQLPRRAGRLLAWRRVLTDLSGQYQRAHGRRLRILRPRTFTEKMQWRKVFDRDPTYPQVLDKVAVRRRIRRRAGEEFLVPLQWVGAHPGGIPFDELTVPYVLKSTHACGHVIQVDGSTSPDHQAIRREARQWLTVDHGLNCGEWGYTEVRPRLMVESRVGTGVPRSNDASSSSAAGRAW